jgi:hypothetical protein
MDIDRRCLPHELPLGLIRLAATTKLQLIQLCQDSALPAEQERRSPLHSPT